MISPVGSFIVQLDGLIMGGIDNIVASVSQAIQIPLMAGLTIYYGLEGFKVANGDPQPLHGLVGKLLRTAVLLYLATNMVAYNYYIRDVLCTGVPAWLTAAVTNLSGGPVSSSSTMATSFDALYSSVWHIIAVAWMGVSLSVSSIAVLIAGLSAGLVAGVGLLIAAVIYVSARMMIAVMVCLGPLLIACGLFPATRPFLERWIGKVVSLVLLQAVTFLILAIVIAIDRSFVLQVINASVLDSSTDGAMPQVLNALVGLIVVFIGGTYILVFHPQKIAYSIGTGLSLSSIAETALGLQAITSTVTGWGGGGDKKKEGNTKPDYQVHMGGKPPAQIEGAKKLPPPPPPRYLS